MIKHHIIYDVHKIKVFPPYYLFGEILDVNKTNEYILVLTFRVEFISKMGYFIF